MTNDQAIANVKKNPANQASVGTDHERLRLEKAKADFEKSLTESASIQSSIEKCKAAALLLDQSIKKTVAVNPAALENFFADLKLARNPNGEITKTSDGQVYGYVVSQTTIIWPFSNTTSSIRKDPGLAQTIDQYTNRSLASCERRR